MKKVNDRPKLTDEEVLRRAQATLEVHMPLDERTHGLYRGRARVREVDLF